MDHGAHQLENARNLAGVSAKSICAALDNIASFSTICFVNEGLPQACAIATHLFMYNLIEQLAIYPLTVSPARQFNSYDFCKIQHRFSRNNWKRFRVSFHGKIVPFT